MTGVLPRALVAKEARALAPVWLASAVTIVAAAAVADAFIIPPGARAATTFSPGSMRLLAVSAYLIGATTLGALSVGHEYTHRTLSTLLAQPIDRRHILLAKRIVLAGWLLALGLLAWLLLFRGDAEVWTLAGAGQTGWWGWSLIVLPIVWALCIAPWFTLLCRNVMAGLVFTLAVPAVCWAAASSVIFARGGLTPAAWEAGEAIMLTLLWAGVAVTAVTGIVAGGRLFARAEAIDSTEGMDTHERVQARLEGAGDAGVRRQRPVWLLLGKELRLQIWLAAVAALYVLTWAAVSLWRPEPDLVSPLLSMATALYGVVIALFAGSLASAEERGLGTIEWQTLLPYPVWKAWAVKVTTTFALVSVLAVGLPVLLTFVGPVAGEWRATPILRLTPYYAWAYGGGHWFLVTGFFLAGATVVVVSLYVSSLCASGLRALIVSFPVVAMGSTLVGVMVAATNQYLGWGLGVQARVNEIFRTRGFTVAELRAFGTATWVSDLIAMALALAIVGALLWLACRNHHAARGGATLPRRQVAGLVIGVVAASCASGAVWPVLLYAWLTP